LDAAAESVKETIEQHHHRLNVSAPAEPLYLQADPARFEQILVNLLTNAAKYMPDGGQIHLSCDKEESEVVIRCRDEGVGMSPHTLTMIFDPFVQVNPGLDRTGSGLGVGLTLVKKLAELHGGSITAASEGPGKGSEFTLRLPMLPETPQPGDGTSRQAGAAIKPSGSWRILLVDDNSDLANSSAMFLESAGHQVVLAYDGKSALEMALRDKPDVVLLDLGLPDMTGYAVAERLRANGDLKDTPIVAVSGYKAGTDGKAQKADFAAHLVKPVSPDQLLAIVELLRQKSLQGK
jgi:CheY-like chemotaxis protein